MPQESYALTGSTDPVPASPQVPGVFPVDDGRGPPEDPAGRLLCLGDSYTVGEGVQPGGSWPDQLVQRLLHQGFVLHGPRVVARSGWAAGELEVALQAMDDRGELAGPFGLVTLLIGVNDQYRGGRAPDISPVVGRLLGRAVALAGGHPEHVLVISLPDWGVTPYARDRDRDREAIGREIDAFNAVLRERAAGIGAGWVDITALTRRLGANPGFITGDGLHLTAAAYAEWVEVLAPRAREILRRRAPDGI